MELRTLALDERLDLLIAGHVTLRSRHRDEETGEIPAVLDVVPVTEADLDLPAGVGATLRHIASATTPFELFRWRT